MKTELEIPTFNEFNEYYSATNGKIRSKLSEFHIFRLGDIGSKVVKDMRPFRINYFHLSLGSTLHVNLRVFGKMVISEDYSLVIFAPGQVIEWNRTAPWQGYAIDVKEEFINFPTISEIATGFHYLFESAPIVIRLSKEEFGGLTSIYELIYEEHKKLGKENILVIKNLLQVLIIYIDRLFLKNHLSKVKRKVNNHFLALSYFEHSSRFKSLVMRDYMISKSVQYYADKLNVTPAVLNKSLQKTIGKSPKQFISDMLLAHSKTMLSKPTVGIKQISQELQFDDYSHFVKFFKSMTGSTPAEFRKKKESFLPIEGR